MLEVPKQDQEHFDAVMKFAEANGLKEQLEQALDRLRNYSYYPDDPESVEKKCTLRRDYAPHSFAFEIYRPDPEKPGEWVFWFNGGLIFQGPKNPANGSAPSFTVSLAEGTGWFMHT